MYPSKHTYVFEREIQPMIMVKSLCESAADHNSISYIYRYGYSTWF